MNLGNGTLLNNRYKILDILGRGGMGAVYHAIDESLGVDVAVKENLFTTDDYARQFRNEAVILAGLRHPNLPRVTDHFVLDGQGQYLVMDYIEGDDLRQHLEKQGVLSEEEAIRVGVATCEALTYLHNRKPPILHRDIKLGNVKLTPDGGVVLVDFGLAKMAWAHEETVTGARAMTPGYSPPEQYGSARTDARSDIYSLGATLYAAITGVVPEDSLMRAVDGLTLTPIRNHKPAISPRLASVIEKAMETNPNSRFQSAEEFRLALLGEAQANAATLPQPTTPAESAPQSIPAAPARKKRGGGIVPLLLLLLIALASGGILYFSPESRATLLGWVAPNLLPTATSTATLTPQPSTIPASATPAPLPTATLTLAPTQAPTETATAKPSVTATSTAPATETATATESASATPTAEEAETAPEPKTLRVAYASSEGSDPAQIFLTDLENTETRQLTEAPQGACDFDISPDATQLVYVSPCPNRLDEYRTSSLYLLDIASKMATPLQEGNAQGDFDPVWSPDGGKILFTSVRSGGYQIYAYDLTLQTTTQLTSGQTQARYPAFSPDGATVVYSVLQYGKYFLWTMNPDGTAPQRLTNSGEKLSDMQPAYAKDGAAIVFSQTRTDTTLPSLFLLTLADAALSPLTQIQPPAEDASFSPDGAWLVYESTQNGNRDIYLYNLEQAAWRKLTNASSLDFDPRWLP